MVNRKNRWLKVALAIALLSIAVGCDTSKTSESTAGKGGIPDLGPAPTVTLTSLDGQTAPLSQYRGKVVLVNFWATWCEPCKSEIPELIQLQNEYAGRGFTVLGVAMDQEGKSVVAPFVARPQFEVGGQKVRMNYPIMLGTDKTSTKFGGLLGMPTSFLISRDGKVVKKTIGMIDQHAMSDLIQQLL